MKRLTPWWTVAVAVVVVGAGVVASNLAPGSSSPASRIVEARTAAELDAAVHECSDCTQLAYVWSPSMPLSRLGVAEAEEAAGRLEVPLVVVPESAVVTPASGDAETLRRALVASGATVHYPSIAIVRNGEVQGNAVVGYKRAEGYEALLEPRLGSGDERGRAPAPIASAAAVGAGSEQDESGLPGAAADADAARGGGGGGSPFPRTAASATSPDIEVVWTYAMRPAPGAFFRRLPGTRFISYDQRSRVWLVNVETDERIQGPGWIDFVPTPDGRLFVTPAEGHRGLEFYVASEVIRIGRSDGAEAFRTVHVDRDMTDQYPSVGIVEESEDGMRTRYRILISWFEGLVFRDYEVRWSGYRDVRIRPVTPKRAACPGMGLSTPILSKDGREVAARDEATGTTKIFRLSGDGGCTQVQDLGIQTSKVGFSDDGRLVAFSSPEGDGTSFTYVFDRDGGTTTRIPDSRSRGLVIPEFVGPDSLLYLAVGPRDRNSTEFRMVCCVR